MTTHSFRRQEINLANWRLQPYSQWTFQNVGEIVPSATVASRRKPETTLRALGDLANLPVDDLSGAATSLEQFLARHSTDAFVVMRGGEFVAEWYSPHCDPSRPHLIFSITKSMTGLLAAALVERGMVAYETRTDEVLPEMRGSAFADATLRHLLDMQVSVDFVDDYLDTQGAFDRYRRAMLWNPERGGADAPPLRGFLASLSKASHAHGTQHAYHSINTDMAGLFLEAATGRRFADLMSELVWKPLGAHSDAFITVDREGASRAAGGMSTTARDLARVGEMIRLRGAGIIAQAQMADIWSGGNSTIWAAGDQAWLFDGGSYRSCFYHDGRGCLAGIGIHGQWLWIDPSTETVIVRLSCEPVPVNEKLDHAVIAMLRAVAIAS